MTTFHQFLMIQASFLILLMIPNFSWYWSENDFSKQKTKHKDRIEVRDQKDLQYRSNFLMDLGPACVFRYRFPLQHVFLLDIVI